MLRGVLNAAGDSITTPLADSRPSAEEWTLDRRGNWTTLDQSFGGTPGTPQTRTANPVNQYTAISYGSTPVVPEYDSAGNMTFDPLAWNHAAGPAGLKYTFDEENRLAAARIAVDNSLLMEIKYDALGRRVETIEYFDAATNQYLSPTRRTTHIYEGFQAVQEYVCTAGSPSCTTWTLTREFAWGDANRFPEPLVLIDHTSAGAIGAGAAEPFHYLADALGSAVGLTDANGTLVERYSYDPYGKPYIERWNATTQGWEDSLLAGPIACSAFGNPFMWSGQRFDALTGLHHFPFRSFSSNFGRWCQRDAIGYPNSLSLYEYVASRPLRALDPLGLYGEETHYGKTKAIASEHCSDDAAEKIAKANQAQDNPENEAPLNGLISILTFGLANLWPGHHDQYDVHFPGAGPVIPFCPQSPIVEGMDNKSVRSRLDAATKNCDLDKFGQALHSLQDSYSHGGSRGLFACGGHPSGRPLTDPKSGERRPSRGLLDLDVDNPKADPERYQRAQNDTRRAIEAFKKACPKACGEPCKKDKESARQEREQSRCRNNCP